jgi:inositol oxygenase
MIMNSINFNFYISFENEEDKELRTLVQKFQKCDLYSKVETKPDIKKLKIYYDSLIKKYLDNEVLCW